MKKIMCGFLLVSFVLVPANTIAWGEKGHNLVAEIAFSNLNGNTRNQVLQFLDGMTIQEAANWMDTKRNDPSFDYMKPFHYVNFEAGTAVTTLNGDNIINSINGAIQKLENYKSLSREEVKFNLLLLFHLVGDLHQPLHVGYGIDKGGNKIQVRFCGKGTNLHKLWDTDMIEHKKLKIENCLNYQTYTKAELDKIQNINIQQWATESRSYLDSAYAFEGTKIKNNYVNSNYPIIQSQIQKAGLRLAGILEQIFE